MNLDIGKFYTGNDKQADYLFSLDDWITIKKDLTIASTLFKILANNNHLAFIEDIRGYWPGVRVRTQRGLKKKEFELMLNHNYFEDKKIIYELNTRSYYKAFIFHSFPEFITLSTFTQDQINDKIFLVEELRKALSNW